MNKIVYPKNIASYHLPLFCFLIHMTYKRRCGEFLSTHFVCHIYLLVLINCNYIILFSKAEVIALI